MHIPSDITCDKTIFDLASIIMNEHNMSMPSDAYKALTLYTFLRREIKIAL